ncbi:DUF2807 domain-containing protein [Solitalea sp. MAHUQ-68]|uniref:DUF2807 domain-containing protein n=1 Tax=Solitalea agri TaxID=2953739 RepID=A0A9X2F0S6_9SPHI|nr:head GIN domain-containing protein [Solitalea agri]MCO4291965.1 DUF2807 domain-containing protein [Solitalea agri]
MKSSIFYSLQLLLIVLSFTSCRNTIEGSGNYKTEERAIGEINAVESSGEFTIILHKDSISSVRIYAEDNIIPELTTQLKGNKTLSIYYRDHRTKYVHGKVEIYVPVKNLNSVDLSGSGSIKNTNNTVSENLKLNISGSGTINMVIVGQNLTSSLSGSGLIQLQGSVINNNQTISGSGKIKSFGLTSENAKVNISGSGDSEVNVSKTLDATISGSGNVIYMGTPVVNVNISGSGKVRKN